MDAFQVVERPTHQTTLPDGLEEALIGTFDSGKAVQLTVESRQHYMTWQVKVRTAMKQRGYRLRTKYNKSEKIVTAWVEKPTDGTEDDEEV